MNTKKDAENNILKFLQSEMGTMILSGTHMWEKHLLLLNVIADNYSGLKILFRVNSMSNTENRNFLGRKTETGKAYNLDGNDMYIDSINSGSWKRTPNNFDIIIMYPAGSLSNKNSEVTKNNLLDIYKYKNTNKVIFVTCQEREDISHLKEYDDIFHVQYDSEEDDLEYHNRVIGDQCVWNFSK